MIAQEEIYDVLVNHMQIKITSYSLLSIRRYADGRL